MTSSMVPKARLAADDHTMIAFSPALGETVHVSADAARKSAIQLHFTATMPSLEDYAHVASGHAKLQVWSDIPAGGRSSGDWGETDFRPIHSGSLSDDGFSLLSDEQDDMIRTTLALDFSVPSLPGQRFSFTYRMVYPTGETKWLGQYGQNGSLVLDHTRPESNPVLLGEGWVLTDDGSYRRESDGRAVQDLEVAKLARPTDYDVLENSFLYPKDSALLVLVPRLASHSVTCPPTLICGTTPSGSVSFTADGAITTSGTGSLLLAVCDSAAEVDLVMSKMENHCSSPRFRVANVIPGAAVLVFPMDRYLVEVAVILIASPKLLNSILLTPQTLASLIPEPSQFCVFAHRSARFFSREDAEASDESIPFLMTQSGGQFVLAPVEIVERGEERWRVAVVPPFAATSSADGLPTPPPSPRLRPLPHRVSEATSASPDPSFLRLPGVVSPEERSLASSSSGTQLVLHSASRRRAGVLTMIRHIFFVLFAWFARFFRRPRPAVLPTRRADERTPLLQQEASYAQAQPQPRVEVSAFEEWSAEQTPAVSTSSSISVDVRGGKCTILCQAEHPASHFEEVPIRLNRQDVELSGQRTKDGVFIVEFSSAAGGKLKIGW